MGLPDVSLTIRDGALGVVPPNTNNLALKVGVAALGIVNTIYSASDLPTLKSQLGNGGPLVEAAALSLSVAGGPLYCVPVNPSAAGTVSSVTKVGTGAETVAVAAKNAMQLVFKVTTAGAVGTAYLALSLDGGVTYGTPFVTAATVVVPGCSFVTIACGGTTFNLGDTYTVSTAGAVSQTGSGTGTVAISAASPLDAYTAIITIVAGGALGTATFTYSLDNGATVSAVQTVPSSGTFVIPDTGLVLTFTGSSTAGDYFTFTTTPPGYSSTDLTNALNAVFADSRTWFLVHAVGAPSSSANAAALVATLDTLLTTAATSYRFARGLIENPSDTDASILSAYTTTSSLRVGVGAGYYTQTSPINGRQLSRNCAWQAAARAAKVVPSEDLGRTATGSLPGVVSLARDERATPGLDVARFITLRTIVGRQGFYITNGNLLAPTGSDFNLIQRGRVMDIGSSTVRNALLIYLNDSVRVDPSTGYILEADARAIENYVLGQLKATLVQPGYCSSVTFTVTRNNNILSTNQLQTTLRITPLGYSKQITVDIGFSNPALVQKSF